MAPEAAEAFKLAPADGASAGAPTDAGERDGVADLSVDGAGGDAFLYSGSPAELAGAGWEGVLPDFGV